MMNRAAIYEDDLPADMPQEAYDAWYALSYVDGVRMGPPVCRHCYIPMTMTHASWTLCDACAKDDPLEFKEFISSLSRAEVTAIASMIPKRYKTK